MKHLQAKHGIAPNFLLLCYAIYVESIVPFLKVFMFVIKAHTSTRITTFIKVYLKQIEGKTDFISGQTFNLLPH